MSPFWKIVLFFHPGILKNKIRKKYHSHKEKKIGLPVFIIAWLIGGYLQNKLKLLFAFEKLFVLIVLIVTKLRIYFVNFIWLIFR